MKKRNLKLRKVIMMVCCALALVALSVGVTVAYLTDKESVTNTFTVGKVDITLDESKTDEEGNVVAGADRVQKNIYHLIPSQKYTKDPTVHVAADSEDCFVFVKVENDIEAIEDSSNTIAAQITAKGWNALPNNTGVYYKKHTKHETVEDYVVFEYFKIADTVDNATLAKYTDATVKVTAYAIQESGFVDAEAAWEAGNDTTNGWTEYKAPEADNSNGEDSNGEG